MSDLELTWVGHSTVLMQLGTVRLLTDPVLGRRVGLLRRVAGAARADDSTRIDAILVSHLHADHADARSLRRVGESTLAVAPAGAATWLRRHGLRDVREVGAGVTTTVAGVTIEVVPARHDGRRWPRGPAAEAVGFLVGHEPSVYFAGDTDLFPEMEALAGRVDIALLPIWGWGATLGPGHLDPERAAEAARIIRPRVAIPIHWGTLAPPWRSPASAARDRPAQAFAAKVGQRAPDVEVRLLQPGERAVFDRAGAR